MPVTNVCCACGRNIKTREPSDPFLFKMLNNSTTAICNVCDPNSGWYLANPIIDNEGRIGSWEYKEVITKYGVGLVLSTKTKEIYFPPLASKRELREAYSSLPEHIRVQLVDYPLIKKII